MGEKYSLAVMAASRHIETSFGRKSTHIRKKRDSLRNYYALKSGHNYT
jgi:hypothetical protein